MSSWFECKWNSEKCDKCIGCRVCGNCIHSYSEYWEINDSHCKQCSDNPYDDDRNN